MTVIASILDRPNISLYTFEGALKTGLLLKDENSALSEHTCLASYTVGWDKSKIITTNQCYHQCLRLKALHINSAHASVNHDDSSLLPYAYLHLIRKKGQLISDGLKIHL